MDEVAYQVAFENWLDERNSQLLENANNILKNHSNMSHFNELLKIYKLDNLRPFIGAGLSIPSGLPGWGSFLESCCSDYGISSIKFNEVLQQNGFEEAAQFLYKEIKSNVFNEYLERKYNSEFVDKILGTINYIPKLFPNKHIITTNFDEKNNNEFPRDTVLYGQEIVESLRILSKQPKVLIKMHGKHNRCTARVLLKDEYDAVYNTEGFTNFYKNVVFKDSLLFLGCSLSVDRTVKKMTEIVQESGMSDSLPRHYAFLAEEENYKTKTLSLGKANIFPIWYPKGQHDESIEALLYKLFQDKNK